MPCCYLSLKQHSHNPDPNAQLCPPSPQRPSFFCPSLPLKNRGSQKPLRLPNIFAKLFPPTKLQRGTGVDHVTSSQPRGLLLGLCTHLWLCGGVLQRLHGEWVLLGDNVMDLRFHCQPSRCFDLDMCTNSTGALGCKKGPRWSLTWGDKTYSLNGLTRHVDAVAVVEILPCFAHCILRT